MLLLLFFFFGTFFFFKQKTAYEMRISDWSSDVCSSDLKAILDIHHAFDGSPERFRTIAKRHGARYLLICPNFAEGTIYQARSPDGFYAQMLKGEHPDWLSPVNLGPKLPYQLYRINYGSRRSEEHTSELQSLMRRSY